MIYDTGLSYQVKRAIKGFLLQVCCYIQSQKGSDTICYWSVIVSSQNGPAGFMLLVQHFTGFLLLACHCIKQKGIWHDWHCCSFIVSSHKGPNRISVTALLLYQAKKGPNRISVTAVLLFQATMDPTGFQLLLYYCTKPKRTQQDFSHCYVAVSSQKGPNRISVTAVLLFQAKRDPTGFQFLLYYCFKPKGIQQDFSSCSFIVSSQKGSNRISVTSLSLFQAKRDPTGFQLLLCCCFKPKGPNRILVTTVLLFQAKRDLPGFQLLLCCCFRISVPAVLLFQAKKGPDPISVTALILCYVLFLGFIIGLDLQNKKMPLCCQSEDTPH